MKRSDSWRRKLGDSSSSWDTSWKQPDFGTEASVGGVAGDSSIGMSEILGANHSTTGDFSLPSKRPIGRSDLSYYENDSVMLWSDDPEKEYFTYMLQREQEQRARQGKSAEDSLIGDSTLEDIQQEFSQWHQHGGGQSPSKDTSLTDDPAPPGSHYVTPRSPNIDGFSLATTEKESKKEIPSKTPPVPPAKNHKEFFPDVIYVTDAATSVATSKPPSIGSRCTRWRRNKWCYLVIFLIGCFCLVAAVVAIYLSESSKDGNDSSNVVSSIQDSSGATLLPGGNGGATFRPTNMPTMAPSPLLRDSTSAPTAVEQTDTSPRPTLNPSSAPISVQKTSSPTQYTTDPTLAPTVPLSTLPATSDPTTNPTSKPILGNTPGEGPAPCGCKNCELILSRMADGFSCGARINFLIYERGYSELGACRLVAGVEFPSVCGPYCDPDKCEGVDESTEPAPVPAASSRPGLRPGVSAPKPSSALEEAVVSGNNGQPGSAFPLGLCEGDCDNDAQCEEGLICFQRGPGEPVPGCLQGDQESAHTDFCVLPDDQSAAMRASANP